MSQTTGPVLKGYQKEEFTFFNSAQQYDQSMSLTAAAPEPHAQNLVSNLKAFR
jgi:hypothetical protein